MKNKNQILMAIVLAVVFGGAGFWAGTKFSQISRRTSVQAQFGNGTYGNRNGNSGTNGTAKGAAAGSGLANRGGQTIGEILSVGEGTITVKTADGGSKIVLVSSSTAINKAEAATTADLTAGTTVAVFGNTNTDGSVTATNVQIDPTNMMRGPNGQAPSGTPQTQ